jgi:coenzyme F420-0:L-glutamate ligase/coenzyme F420-1:gamma-L-glutamate ligase
LTALTIAPLPGIAEIRPGDDLGAELAGAIVRTGIALAPYDVLVVAQKVVSKAENRYVDLHAVQASPRAHELAAITGKDARFVELVLGESTEVLRAKPEVLIVRHTLGYVMANAGIDRSNVDGTDRVLLLPRDPDGSAAVLRARLAAQFGVRIGVVISDSFGRPWRIGVTNVALGAAGVPAFDITEVAFADLLASAAGLAIGEGAEGQPAALVRGARWNAPSKPASVLIRPLQEDLFR